MAANGHIKNYSATDIEKYHHGQLSEKERHDLEKAALDDPFLADALEGYAVAGVNIQPDILELKERLSSRLQDEKVVPITKAGRPFPWLRVAALIVVITGLGLLANQFLSKDKRQKGIAKLEETKQAPQSTTTTDTGSFKEIGSGSSKLVEVPDVKPVAPKNNETYFTITENDGAKKPENKAVGEVNHNRREDQTVASNLGSGNAPVPVKTIESPAKEEKINKDIAIDETRSLKNDNKVTTSRNADVGYYKTEQESEDFKKKNAAAASRKANEDRAISPGFYDNSHQVNSFRGRVTDANNIGLPFARVFNPTDNNAGTYTDAAGNFNLIYPDTVLDVQVKSVGFENTNVQLRSATTNNQVVLQDDHDVAQITVNNQSPNATVRSLSNNVKIEEPEPVDGWIKYDAYLTNNLNIPEELNAKDKPTGQVQLSFEVNKEGDPVNIRVEKSLCGKCDKEAIRLVKAGPKWKRNANKKGRTTVTINF